MTLKTYSCRMICFAIGVFIGTAFLGVLFAYDQGAALSKFIFLTISISFFFLFTRLYKPQQSQWIIFSLFTLLGFGMAIFFLFTNDWVQNPAKINIINQIGLWWMRFRPSIPSEGIYHNSAAGVMALTFPFALASGIHFWRKKQILRVVFVFVLGGVSLVGFVLTTSRGAALAVAYGFLIWLLYSFSKKLHHSTSKSWFIRVRLLLLTFILIAAGWSFITLAGPVSFSTEQAVLTNSGSRLELYRNSIKLVEDFPIIGAGLSAFPAVYSTYILDIPNFFFPNAHNLYLNIAVEQGVFGFLVLIAIYLFSFWSILRYQGNQDGLLIGATLASLVIVMLHNLVDNVVGKSFLSILLFVLPGFTFAVVRPGLLIEISAQADETVISHQKNKRKISINFKLIACIFVGFAVTAVLLFHNFLFSTWFANLGAMQMAKIELVGFPTNAWDTGQHLEELAPAEANFQQALRYNPANRTAYHRLGLIEMMRKDFPQAVSYLESAYQVDPDHRGIIKSLGYAYAWTGQFDKALPLLAQISEAQQELETYQWWWGTLNRPDLSIMAEKMTQKLASAP